MCICRGKIVATIRDDSERLNPPALQLPQRQLSTTKDIDSADLSLSRDLSGSTEGINLSARQSAASSAIEQSVIPAQGSREHATSAPGKEGQRCTEKSEVDEVLLQPVMHRMSSHKLSTADSVRSDDLSSYQDSQEGGEDGLLQPVMQRLPSRRLSTVSTINSDDLSSYHDSGLGSITEEQSLLAGGRLELQAAKSGGSTSAEGMQGPQEHLTPGSRQTAAAFGSGVKPNTLDSRVEPIQSTAKSSVSGTRAPKSRDVEGMQGQGAVATGPMARDIGKGTLKWKGGASRDDCQENQVGQVPAQASPKAAAAMVVGDGVGEHAEQAEGQPAAALGASKSLKLKGGTPQGSGKFANTLFGFRRLFSSLSGKSRTSNDGTPSIFEGDQDGHAKPLETRIKPASNGDSVEPELRAGNQSHKGGERTHEKCNYGEENMVRSTVGQSGNVQVPVTQKQESAARGIPDVLHVSNSPVNGKSPKGEMSVHDRGFNDVGEIVAKGRHDPEQSGVDILPISEAVPQDLLQSPVGCGATLSSIPSRSTHARALERQNTVGRVCRNLGLGTAIGILGVVAFFFGQSDNPEGEQVVLVNECEPKTAWVEESGSEWMQNWLWHSA